MLSLLTDSQRVVRDTRGNNSTVTTGNGANDIQRWHPIAVGAIGIFPETDDGTACRDCSAKG